MIQIPDIMGSLSNPTRSVVDVSVQGLREFPGHPFHVRDDEDMRLLRDSVREQGVREPILVRREPDGDGYQIVSGHRRVHAARLEGLATVPAIVIDADDDTATVIMVDANLHRSTILPSEKARAYRARSQALAHQGRAGGSTRDLIARQTGESPSAVARWARLGALPDGILEALDTRQTSQDAALALCDAPDAVQDTVADWLARDRAHRLTARLARAVATATDAGQAAGILDAPAPATPRARLKVPAEWVPDTVDDKLDWIRRALQAYRAQEGGDR